MKKRKINSPCIRSFLLSVLIVLGICTQNSNAAKSSDAAFIEYKYSPTSEKNFKAKDGSSYKINASEYDVKTKFAIPLYEVKDVRPIFIFLNINYELLSCNYALEGKQNASLSSIDKLHSIGSSIGAYVSLNKGLGMVFNVGGSLNTNLDEVQRVDQKDLSVNGNVVFIRTNKNMSYQYGITTSSSFGKPMILPIVGFSWKPTPWFQYSVLIPQQTSAWFLGDKWSLGLTALIDGMQYRLIRDDQANNFTLSRSTVESDIALRYKVWKNLSVYSELCYLVKQTVTLNEPDNSKNSEIEFSGDKVDRVSIRAGIAFSPH